MLARVQNEQLITTCRILRQVLEQPVPASVRMMAPHLATALPVLRELVDGIEDLADRVSILEAFPGIPRRQAGR